MKEEWKMPNITIHGKRTETIYAFMVEHKGEKITGRYIRENEADEDEPLGFSRLEWDNPYDSIGMTQSEWTELVGNIKQAIEEYEKTKGE